MSVEKVYGASQVVHSDNASSDSSSRNNNATVFAKSETQVDFRTVHWLHAGIIFLKGKSTNN